MRKNASGAVFSFSKKELAGEGRLGILTLDHCFRKNQRTGFDQQLRFSKKSKQIVKELTLDCLLDGGFLNEILHFFEFFF
jgi:hypothetical protein